ncbi:hypothetical protein [Dyadobacter sp. CY326]|uniref:hypothetical protein n=1 Tax=Dyadobacter sp. CY326 TaxID=2907300 RepID=UPI001F3236E1|nr:hypothetical protein [Dyadobacter sp. CY326]MCE7065925.1 hypothetical protein [Dyadobacter sp. CY326]
MPDITNQDPSGKLEAGVILAVTGASSEDEAMLAVENYLRVNKKEGSVEMSVLETEDEGSYHIKLG